MRKFTIAFLIIILAGCRQSEPPAEPEPAPMEPAPSAETSAPASTEQGDPRLEPDRLGRILDAQSEEMQTRYDERHPRATLEFFGIEPGTTLVEALPGGGWYTRILLPYLGSEGRLIATNYPLELWPNFAFATDEFMADIRKWPVTFPDEARSWCDGDCAQIDTFWLGSLPDDAEGRADAVLFVRALHNLARFQIAGVDDYLDQALADAHAVLKPGGVLGVVQHEAPADMPDDWADGSNGYLKKQFVIDQVEAAGFELVAESDINANPNDRPGPGDFVWRLPPSLSVPEDAEDRDALLAQYEAIGESNRMTLKFRKPDDPVR